MAEDLENTIRENAQGPAEARGEIKEMRLVLPDRQHQSSRVVGPGRCLTGCGEVFSITGQCKSKPTAEGQV